MDLNPDYKVLNSLNYFSILFAPLFFPLLIFVFVNEKTTRFHAKRALLLHLLSTIPGAIALILGIFLLLAKPGTEGIDTAKNIVILTGITYLGFMIWNLMQGFKVLK